jgi:hypothetical protein
VETWVPVISHPTSLWIHQNSEKLLDQLPFWLYKYQQMTRKHWTKVQVSPTGHLEVSTSYYTHTPLGSTITQISKSKPIRCSKNIYVKYQSSSIYQSKDIYIDKVKFLISMLNTTVKVTRSNPLVPMGWSCYKTH